MASLKPAAVAFFIDVASVATKGQHLDEIEVWLNGLSASSNESREWEHVRLSCLPMSREHYVMVVRKANVATKIDHVP